MHCDCFILLLLLLTSTIWLSPVSVNERVIRGIGRKWKSSDFSDSDSVELMTRLMTPIFDVYKVISTLATPLMILTLTLSLMKTSLSPHFVV